MRTGPKPSPQALQTPQALPPDLLIEPPEPPATFDEQAAVQWYSITQILIDRGTLTRGDLATLENFVRVGIGVQAAIGDGNWRLADKLIGSQTRLARELGLTPSSRLSFPAVGTPESSGDELETFKSTFAP